MNFLQVHQDLRQIVDVHIVKVCWLQHRFHHVLQVDNQGQSSYASLP